MGVLEQLIDWYLNSAIYEKGSYLTHYSKNNKGLPYPEITAYSLSLSSILYKKYEDDVFLERAKECAAFLMKNNLNGGLLNYGDNLLYTFDTGIYVSGLLDLYTVTDNEIYLHEAEESLNWLLNFWDGNQFLAVNKCPIKKEWSHNKSVHLTKLVIPLLKASYYLDEKYKRYVYKLLSFGKSLQMENGSFQVFEGIDMVMTHPHCYATEGFLYAYHTFKRQEFLDVVKKSSDWLSKIQNSDGSLCRSYAIGKNNKQKRRREKVKTSDATAQATRIWKLLGVNQEGIEKAYRYLFGELKDNGLRLYKSDSLRGILFSWRRPIHSWPTFFYLHSLLLPFGEIEYCNELF